MPVRILTFRTPDPIYEYAGMTWRAGLDRLGIDYEVFVVPPFENGSWVLANHSRPAFIRARLLESPDPVFWLDIDTIVWDDFTCTLDALWSGMTDFAAHWFDDGRLFGSNLYFGNTDATRRLLDLWEMFLPKRHEVMCHVDESYGNQMPLQRAVEQLRRETARAQSFNEQTLAESMAFLTDLREHGKRNANPKIECFQISRVIKHPWWIEAASERQAQAVIYRERRRPACQNVHQQRERISPFRKLAKMLRGE